MKKILLTLCFAAAAIGAQAAAPCTPVGLRCEHLEAPLGIDAPAPRLGWRLDDSRSGALQRAYRVVVGRDSAAVHKSYRNSASARNFAEETALHTSYSRR